MQKTVYQVPELRDANDNIIQQGAFGKNTALANATNDGWIDYVMNDLEALHDVVGETSPTLDANGHVVEPANLAIGDEDGNRIKESYLKLSGGKVTGIASFRTDLRMLDNQDNRWGGLYVPGTTSSVQYLSLYGGTRATGDARLNLYNVGNGKFELTGYSTDGANAYTLTHDNNGNLNWRGYPLAWKKDYLPLAGGTMTGTIVQSQGSVDWRRDTDNSFTLLTGASDYTKGACLALSGKDRTGYEGKFELLAKDGTSIKSLVGSPNGSLTWDNNAIALSKDVLHISGGTMTGSIVSAKDPAMIRNNDNSVLTLCGGTAYNKGAFVTLYGENNETYPGWFSIHARKTGVADIGLVGKPDGTLTWNNNNIITSVGGSIYRLFGTSNQALLRSVDNDFLIIGGGTAYNKGGYIAFSGQDRSVNGGSFELNARTESTGSKTLLGKIDGSLTWNGQPIQTSSDKRLKRDFADVPDDVLEAWGKVNWQQFKYIDDAERKGVNNCRWHTGLVAQDVKEVGEDNNVDLLRYGILCHEVRMATAEQEAVDLWTVRYEEALAMEAAYQRRRADRLEERIARLEALLTNTETEMETE